MQTEKSFSQQPADDSIRKVNVDDKTRELPDIEPTTSIDPDDLVRAFPPKTEIKPSDDIDDLMHPPAIDLEDEEDAG